MQPSTEETESIPEIHPSLPASAGSPHLWRWLRGMYEGFRADLSSFDGHADGLAVRIDNFLKRHERKLRFLKPALLSLIGCIVFAGFDAFGGTHILEHFTKEHVAALGQPYFVLGMFLLAVHLFFVLPDGKSIFGKWVIGTFSSLVEHVILLGWGVFVWLFLAEFVTRPTLSVAIVFVVYSVILVALAVLFYQGAKLCRGEYFHWFEGRPGRMMLMRLVGVVFALAGGLDLHHYLERQHHQSAPSTPATPTSVH